MFRYKFSQQPRKIKRCVRQNDYEVHYMPGSYYTYTPDSVIEDKGLHLYCNRLPVTLKTEIRIGEVGLTEKYHGTLTLPLDTCYGSDKAWYKFATEGPIGCSLIWEDTPIKYSPGARVCITPNLIVQDGDILLKMLGNRDIQVTHAGSAYGPKDGHIMVM